MSDFHPVCGSVGKQQLQNNIFSVRKKALVRILGRKESIFAKDMEAYKSRLMSVIPGSRILVVGAAGSIGAAFVKQVADFFPSALHLVDINENGLVETVRDLRSSTLPTPKDFLTVTVDFGSEEFLRFAKENGPYDTLANFSALKHVRAERDVFSLLRMIDVNVLALDRCLARSQELGFKRVFSVSTDKCVRPANLMGASKNLMEKALFSWPGKFTATSARFANVAFSAGSLLEGFENRLAKNQPFSAPNDVRRYFVSHEEVAQLCLFACFLGEDRQVFFPKLTAKEHLSTFPEIAEAILAVYNLKPLLCASEEEARARLPNSEGYWPCHFSPSDTSGEKSVEEFYRSDDKINLDDFHSVGLVRESVTPRETIRSFAKEIMTLRSKPQWLKDEIVEAIKKAVPELDHIERGRNLDQKM